MKVSDLMLDMGTGDANIHDVYAAEAAGKMNVSVAILEAAAAIAELPKGDFAVVQEAEDAGLPTEPDKAAELTCEAVKEGLSAFFDLTVETAKSIKTSIDKDMKMLLTLGKGLGVTFDGENFAKSFAEPFAKAIVNGEKKFELGELAFLKGKYATKLTKAYVRGMTAACGTYGVDITDVCNETVIADSIGKAPKLTTNRQLVDVISTFSDAGSSFSSFDKVVSKDKHYSSTIKESDIIDLCVGLYAVNVISKTVVDAMSKSVKSVAMNKIASFCDYIKNDKKAGRKVDSAVTSFGTSSKEVTDATMAIKDSVKKAYTDSIFALTEKINKAAAE